MSERLLLALVAAPIGACVGSYVATTAIRASRAEPSAAGRSHCDGCGVGLGFAQTVPIVSFVGLGGRCRECGSRIDPTHFAGEGLGAAIAAASVFAAPIAHALPLAAVGFLLLATSLIDAKTQRLPDILTLAVGLLGLVLAAERSMSALVVGCLAAASSFAALEGVRRLFLTASGRPGLGFGDVKLIAALAVWLGLATPWAVCAAAVLGLGVAMLSRPPNGRIAFGPPIALAAWVVGLSMEAGLWPISA